MPRVHFKYYFPFRIPHGCLQQVRKTVEREVRVLKAVCHANIVSLLDMFQVSGRMHLVFEYVERTVLDSLKLQPEGLGDGATRRILWQLIKAVEYLHTQKVQTPSTKGPVPQAVICIAVCTLAQLHKLRGQRLAREE